MNNVWVYFQSVLLFIVDYYMNIEYDIYISLFEAPN